MIRNFFLLLILAISIASCKDSDSSSQDRGKSLIEASQLEGDWEVYHALRSSVPTRVLENTYFSFSQDSMVTNLPTQDEHASYSWIDNSIVREAETPAFYEVKRLYDDTLWMNVELEGFNFELQLERIEDTKQ